MCRVVLVESIYFKTYGFASKSSRGGPSIFMCMILSSVPLRKALPREVFLQFIQEKLLSQAAVLGLTVIIISSNVIIHLICSACRHKISVNIFTKGFFSNFEIISLDFSSAVIMVCK